MSARTVKSGSRSATAAPIAALTESAGDASGPRRNHEVVAGILRRGLIELEARRRLRDVDRPDVRDHADDLHPLRLLGRASDARAERRSPREQRPRHRVVDDRHLERRRCVGVSKGSTGYETRSGDVEVRRRDAVPLSRKLRASSGSSRRVDDESTVAAQADVRQSVADADRRHARQLLNAFDQAAMEGGDGLRRSDSEPKAERSLPGRPAPRSSRSVPSADWPPRG